MRRLAHLALTALLLAVGGKLACELLCLREPVHHGKRLSAWLQAYQSQGLAGVESWPVRVEQQQADEAVRHAGTNALPTLLRMLRAKDSALRIKFIGLARKQHFLRVKYTPAEELNYQACVALGVLGARAQCAAPALKEIVNQNLSRSSQGYAAAGLAFVGSPMQPEPASHLEQAPGFSK